MKFLDYIIRQMRFRQVAKRIPAAANILDIGCDNGEFLAYAAEQGKLARGTGYDPGAADIRIYPTDGEDITGRYDVVTALATLEHIRDIEPLVSRMAKCTRKGGIVIVTIPSNMADWIVRILIALHLADGMEFGQHTGIRPQRIISLFLCNGFSLVEWRRFQLGLNNILTFKKEA